MKLFRSHFLHRIGNTRSTAGLSHFTSINHISKALEEKNKGKDERSQSSNIEEALNIGRAWACNELRLKSNDQLHKLWYVLLREKNSILADNALLKRIKDTEIPKDRIEKVDKSMVRIKVVMNERKKVADDYRRYLEDKYVEKKQAELKDQYEEEKRLNEMAPEFSHSLLRAKYFALLNGIDNLDYIKRYMHKKQSKEKLKAYLKEKYDYKNKKVVDPEKVNEEELEEAKANPDQYIIGFKNHIEEQMKMGKSKLSQEEILRAHIKNWGALDLKQRRIVLNMINARRARDAKSAFTREINLLAQKIAYENKGMAKLNG